MRFHLHLGMSVFLEMLKVMDLLSRDKTKRAPVNTHAEIIVIADDPVIIAKVIWCWDIRVY